MDSNYQIFNFSKEIITFSQEKIIDSSEIEKKTEEVFDSSLEQVLSSCIEEKMIQGMDPEFNLFNGDHISIIGETRNIKQVIDDSYDGELNLLCKKAEETLKKKGFLDQKEELQLKLDKEDGLCEGGSIVFIKKYLDGQDTYAIAEQFEQGVPIEGSICQEIYESYHLSPIKKIDVELIQAWNEFKPTLEEKLILNYDCSRHEKINQCYHTYLNSKLNNQSFTYLNSSEFVDQMLTNEFKDEPLSPIERFSLYHLDSWISYKVPGITALTFELQGLEIESNLVDYGAKDGIIIILDKVSDLSEGAYQLSFPTYNFFGELQDAHSIALVIYPRTGITLFYDSNYAIAVTSSKNRKQTLKRIVRHYTGYSPNKPNTIAKQIKHVKNNHANPPPNNEMPANFSLYKV